MFVIITYCMTFFRVRASIYKICTCWQHCKSCKLWWQFLQVEQSGFVLCMDQCEGCYFASVVGLQEPETVYFWKMFFPECVSPPADVYQFNFTWFFFDFWLVSIQCSSDIKSKRWKQKFNYFCAWMWGSFKLEWEFYLLWLTMRNDRGLKPIEHNRNGSVEYPQKHFYICWWINCSFFFFSKLCFLNFQFLAN